MLETSDQVRRAAASIGVPETALSILSTTAMSMLFPPLSRIRVPALLN
jgi:hypothetical protein